MRWGGGRGRVWEVMMKGSGIGCSGGTPHDFRAWRQLRWQCHGKDLWTAPGARECIHLHHQWFGLRPSLPISHQLLLPFPGEREQKAVLLASESPPSCYAPACGDAPTLVSSGASKNRRDQELTAEDRLGRHLGASVQPRVPLYAHTNPYLPKGSSPKVSPTSDVHT